MLNHHAVLVAVVAMLVVVGSAAVTCPQPLLDALAAFPSTNHAPLTQPLLINSTYVPDWLFVLQLCSPLPFAAPQVAQKRSNTSTVTPATQQLSDTALWHNNADIA
jgi:hypothetical protein